jgi:NAD(P)-dependent dehydrogenase (short-subunit alcohol dehydrogenase family)
MKKVLIVTGGSRGIGHATSVLAAKTGWDVCVNYVRNKVRADETVAKIQATGQRAIAVRADINNEQDVIRLFETCSAELGVVAGVVTREAIKRMSTKNNGSGGSIVLLSSVSARIGAPGFCVAYAASKGAVDSFAWGAAQEVVGEGIRINAVSPGLIDTEIQPEGRVKRDGPKLPMGRVGQPEEVARAIVWLLSEDASYVAGSNLDVAAGR